MAKVIPTTREAMIQFFSQRAASWAASATAIGLTTAQITEMATLINDAQTKMAAAFAARIASKNATAAYHNAADALRALGSDYVTTIKAKAFTDNNPNIFILASIPEPATPSPLGPPPMPADLTAALSTDGTISLKWTCTRAGGTSFTVQRSTTGTDGTWVLIGSSEETSFIDASVPRGLPTLSYRITAHRSGGSSAPTPPFTVLFGNTAGQQQQSGSGGLTLAA